MTDKEEIVKILDSVMEDGRTVLTEYESKGVLSNWSIKVAETKVARSKLEAVSAARDLKYPVVMKVSSPQIDKKSEVEGVRVGLTSEIEVRQAFDDIMADVRFHVEDADIFGVVVQQYIPDAQEVVMEVIQDPSFGPTVIFGLAGVWSEVLKDFSYRLAPVSRNDAKSMVKEIDAYPLLSGDHGRETINFDELYETIQKMSELPLEYGRISEIRLDPVFVSSEDAIVVDSSIRLNNLSSVY